MSIELIVEILVVEILVTEYLLFVIIDIIFSLTEYMVY